MSISIRVTTLRGGNATGGTEPMSAITLLDNSLKLTIYYDNNDSEYEDNICLHFVEDCPEACLLYTSRCV